MLGALCVAAIALGAVIWTNHRNDVDERSYQTRAMQAAADWTGVLINMNTDNIKESLQRLHDGTVGELNADFDSSIQPYQQVVEQLQSRSRGEVEAVAFEAVHHDLDAQPGGPTPSDHFRHRSPVVPTPSWWSPPPSAKTPAANRRPCTGICGSGSPMWTAS